MKVESWDWTPGAGVGPFRIGDDAREVVARFDLRKWEPLFEAEWWESYEIPDTESSISTEEGKLSSIDCYDHLYYKEKDILALCLDDVRSMLGPESASEVHPYRDGILVVYYSRLGLTLFIDGETIESAVCDEILDDA